MEQSPSKTDQFKELKKLITTLTHTGEKELDPPVLKGITRICKISNDYVIHAYNLLIGYLEANHAEVRLSCFQICIELFKRSHCFRELLVSNLEQVMALTVETDLSKPLPKPRSTALSLKKLALTTIRDWAKQYGSGYKKLHLGISFLKNCKRVDLNAMALEEAAEHSREEELKRRKKAIQNEHFKKVVIEIKEKQPDIISALTEMDNCLSLLLPRPEDFFIDGEAELQGYEDTKKLEEAHDLDTRDQSSSKDYCKTPSSLSNSKVESSESDDEEDCLSKNPIFDFRKYGIINPHFSITLKVDPAQGSEPLVKKTEENAPIFESAEELFKVVTARYHPCILKWETILEKCSDLDDPTVKEVTLRINELKSRLETVVDKYKRLNMEAFHKKVLRKTSDESDTSDSDFEEVQNKAGFEAFSKSAPVKPSPANKDDTSQKKSSASKGGNKKDWSLISDENNEKDPTSVFSTLSTFSSKTSEVAPSTSKSSPSTSLSCNNKEKSKFVVEQEKSCSDVPSFHDQPGPSDDRKAKLLSLAPKLPFDIDLYHWEDEKIEAPTRLTVKPDGHRFWQKTAEDRDEIRDPDGEASLRTRVIEFTGNFEKVKWTCRAPLPSGKLCPRQDRVKCPFHGKIIARDEVGKPTIPEDQQAELERLELEKANEVPDWQDPKLLAELKESTGMDLRMPDKTKRGWRKHKPEEKKYVGLTDLKASHNTTYNRLSKKVFEKSSMRRVAADLNKLDRKRFRDKYGDQFNYVFDH